MKLQFDFNFKGLDGKEVKGMDGKNIHAGRFLASQLSTMNKGNSIKLWDWALKLYNDKPLELDDSDARVLYELIDTSESMTVLAKVQLMKTIDDAKLTEKSKVK